MEQMKETAEEGQKGGSDRAEEIVTSDLGNSGRVKVEAARLSLFLHPTQRDVGKLPILVSTAHIRMGADKPALLNDLVDLFLRIPEGWGIGLAVFVNCNCMEGVLDDPAQLRVVKLE